MKSSSFFTLYADLLRFVESDISRYSSGFLMVLESQISVFNNPSDVRHSSGPERKPDVQHHR